MFHFVLNRIAMFWKLLTFNYPISQQILDRKRKLRNGILILSYRDLNLDISEMR